MNENKLIENLYNYLYYFNLTYNINNNILIYFLIFGLCLLANYLMAILIIFMVNRIRKKQLNVLWPLKILKIIVPFFSNCFFSQSFFLLSTVFNCVDEHSYISPSLKCRSGVWFIILSPLTIISLIFQSVIGILTNMLYFKPIFLNIGPDLLKKTNTIPETVFIITKISINLLFIADNETDSELWGVIFFIILFTGTNAYYTLHYQNKISNILTILNNFFSLFTVSVYILLCIENMFIKLEITGSIYLFFSFLIIIFFYIIFFKNNEVYYILTDYTEINNPIEYLYYISKFYNIIQNKKNSRNNFMNFETLISKIEENCIIPDCPLKKYLWNQKKGVECPFLLTQFCDLLFRYGISKFTDDLFLKNNYSIFLLIKMNYSKKALIILNSIHRKRICFKNRYYIYKTLKLIEKCNNLIYDKNNSTSEYRKISQDFKKLMKKITLLYYDFISLLLNTKRQNSDNFNKINRVGREIVKNNKIIEELYTKLISIKTDNFEIIKIYTEYVEGILCNEEKLEQCQNNTKLVYSGINEINEKDYSNFNIDILNDKGNMSYMIISAQKENLGKIIDLSMNITKIFGYLKNELINQHINIIIPKIYHKAHDIIFMHECEKNQLKLFDSIDKRKFYFPNFVKRDVYGINKLKFLVELKLNIYFIKTENGKLVYIVEILNYNPLMVDLIENNNNTKFCVLTDANFLIQTFTPNCLEFLKLNYSDINSDLNIINYIKEFQNDYLTNINKASIIKYSHIDRSEINSEQKKSEQKKNNVKISSKIKKKIINDLFIKKYSQRSRITWKLSDENNPIKSNIFLKSEIFNDESNNTFLKVKNNNYNNNENNHINLYMEIQKIIIEKKNIGYYFYFTKIKKEKNKNISFLLENNESNNKSNYLKKYQCKIKSIDSINADIDNNNKNECKSFIINLPSFNKNNEINKSRKKSYDNFLKHIYKDNQVDSTLNNYSLISNNVKFNINNIDSDNSEVITGEYIPKFSSHFAIDLKNFYFVNLNASDNPINYLEILKNEADEKIKEYQEQLEKLSDSETKSLHSEESENTSNDSNSSLYSSNSSSFKSIDYNEKTKSRVTTNSEKGIILKTKSKLMQKSQRDNIVNDESNKDINKNISTKRIIKNNILNNSYYKVNLNNIKFMIFDFYKDMLIDGNKKEKTSKIEAIMNNCKNQGLISFSKDENLSFLSFVNYKDKKSNDINKQNNNNLKDNIDNNKKKPNNKKDIFNNKLYEAINKQKDEIPIKKLKISGFISFLFLVLSGCLCIILDLIYLSKINKTLLLFKSSIFIKYYNQISIYYLRELVLLNFDINEIKGGKYINIPDKDKNTYKDLLSKKILELFIGSQTALDPIYTSSLSLSKNSTKILSEFSLPLKMPYDNINVMNYDILGSLMQYSSTFNNLVSSTIPIEQNHADLSNYIYTSLNEYKIIFDILIDLYGNELKKYLNIIIYIVIFVAIMFFVFLIGIFIFVILNFLSSLKKRGNYMKVLFGINENILQFLMNNCENLMNKLKSSEEQKYHEEDTMEGNINNTLYSENKPKMIKKKTISQNINLNNTIDNQSYNKVSLLNFLFILFFGIFLLICYSYFIYNGINMINSIKNTILISNYYYTIQNLHLNIIDTFNAYREYLFDNQSLINNMLVLEYLNKIQRDEHLTMNEDIKFINVNKNKVFPKNSDTINNKSLCNYYTNDYFDSSLECSEKLGLISNYDFDILSYYFLEEIQISKNIIKYKLRNENILGNLTEYKISDYINNLNIPRSEDYSDNSTIFRLDLFNNSTLHVNLNIIFFTIVLPYIEENRDIIFNPLLINGIEKFLVIINIVFYVVVVFAFLCYFIPIINNINNNIYKTKNILSIIPISILSSQIGVSELLNIKND